MNAEALLFPPPAPADTPRTLDNRLAGVVRAPGAGPTRGSKRTASTAQFPVLHTLSERVDVEQLATLADALPAGDLESNKLRKLAEAAGPDGRYEVHYRKRNEEGVGRVFADRSASVALLRSDLRTQVCEPYYIDVDMVNAHPVIALHAAQHVLRLRAHQYEALARYVADREAYLAAMVPGDRKTAKRLVLEMMFGKAMDANFRANLYYVRLRADVVRVRRRLYSQADDLRAIAAKKTTANKEGSVFALYADEIEYRILVCATEFMRERNWETAALTFDGFYLHKREGASIDDSLLRELEAHVESEMLVPMKFAQKPFVAH